MNTNIIRWLTVASFLMLLWITVGCNGNPVVSPDITATDSSSNRAVSGSSHNLSGYNLLAINTETGSIDVLPLRSAEWHFNVVGILNNTMGVSAKGVPAQHDPPNGIFVFDITLEHPFPSKLQFSGFDVKGILVTNGEAVVGGLNFAGLSDTRLLNADGFTRWWNPAEFTSPGMFGYTPGSLAVPGTAFTATCNPYMYFADRLEAEDSMSWVVGEPLDSDLGRGVFRAGESNTRRYRIKFKMNPGPVVYYGYAVDCSWAMPSPNPPAEVPDDFPIQANQPEPYRVGLSETANSLYYDTETGFFGGTIVLDINVYDWQGQAAHNFTGQVDDVLLYCPDLLIDGMAANYVSGDEFKVKYRSNFDSMGPQGVGEVQFFCGAVSGDGSTYQQTAAPAPDNPLTSWNSIVVEVVDPECEADSNNSIGEAVELVDGESVVSTLCGGTDDIDYYKFEIPLGNYSDGSISLHSSHPSTSYELVDSQGVVISAGTLNGWVHIFGAPEKIPSGTYYLSIGTSQPSMAGQYMVIPDLPLVKIDPDAPEDVTPPELSMDATWVHVMGDYLFLANNYFVWVYDISQGSVPVFVSRTEVRSTGEPAFYYPYMYLFELDGGTGTYLRMIDFTDVSAPVLSFAWGAAGIYEFILADADSLYVAKNDGSDDRYVLIYDYATNPIHPESIGSFDIGDNAVRDMAMMYPGTDKESVIVCETGEIAAYNVYDPVNVVLVDSVTTDAMLFPNRFMAISGEYITKVSYSMMGSNYSLAVYHYTDGLSIDFEDSVSIPDSEDVTALDAYGSWIIMGCNSGVNKNNRIYSFVDPTDIIYEDMLQTSSQCTAIAHDEYTLALIQGYMAPKLYDITGFVKPVVKSPGFRFVNYPTSSVIVGDYMYLANNKDSANWRSGIDLTSPPEATVTFSHSLGYSMDFLCGNERILAYTRNLHQLYFDVPDQGAFSNGSNFTLSQNVTSVAVSDEYMYVSQESPSTMKVYNTVLFPGSDPTELPNIACSPPMQNLIVQGEVMYGFDLDTMFMFNLAVPSAPAQSGTYTVSGIIANRLIYGDWLFLLTDSQLRVADISDPMNPVTETTVNLPYSGMKNITRMEQFVICSSPVEHPVFVDITDPTAPVIYGQPITGDPIWPIRGLESSGEYLYELCDSYGVRIYDCY